MHRRVAISVLATGGFPLVVAGCAGSAEAPAATAGAEATSSGPQSAGAGAGDLTRPAGRRLGAAGRRGDLLRHRGRPAGGNPGHRTPPGFHGFHVHAVGRCEPNSASPTDPSTTGDFLSAVGHIGAGQTTHGQHACDLPVLHVGADGTGSLTAVTDALTVDDLTDDDGSAVVMHAGADNYPNIPERYAPGGPDEMTRNTGDSGGRIACGTVEG